MKNYCERININPGILLGKPVFKGTRIPLYVVLDLLAEGASVRKIIKFYPDLEEEDIHAAIRFASDTAKHISEIKLETANR
jgi:uncharacterized protein (DUF433 family)